MTAQIPNIDATGCSGCECDAKCVIGAITMVEENAHDVVGHRFGVLGGLDAVLLHQASHAFSL